MYDEVVVVPEGAIVVEVDGVTSYLTVECYKYNNHKEKFKTFEKGGRMPWWGSLNKAKIYKNAAISAKGNPGTSPKSYFPETSMCPDPLDPGTYNDEAWFGYKASGSIDYLEEWIVDNTIGGDQPKNQKATYVLATCISNCPS